MTVLSVSKNSRRFRSSDPKFNVWPVFIKEVDEEKQIVLASWNTNQARWWGKNIWSKWRTDDPNNETKKTHNEKD